MQKHTKKCQKKIHIYPYNHTPLHKRKTYKYINTHKVKYIHTNTSKKNKKNKKTQTQIHLKNTHTDLKANKHRKKCLEQLYLTKQTNKCNRFFLAKISYINISIKINILGGKTKNEKERSLYPIHQHTAKKGYDNHAKVQIHIPINKQLH